MQLRVVGKEGFRSRDFPIRFSLQMIVGFSFWLAQSVLLTDLLKGGGGSRNYIDLVVLLLI